MKVVTKGLKFRSENAIKRVLQYHKCRIQIKTKCSTSEFVCIVCGSEKVALVSHILRKCLQWRCLTVGLFVTFRHPTHNDNGGTNGRDVKCFCLFTSLLLPAGLKRSPPLLLLQNRPRTNHLDLLPSSSRGRRPVDMLRTQGRRAVEWLN